MYLYLKNLGRLWLAYTEPWGNFTCYNSYLLTLGTFCIGQNGIGKVALQWYR